MPVSKHLMRKRLRNLRENAGFSLRIAAEKAGITKPQLWELETGGSQNPTLDTLTGLCKTYQTTVGYLIGESSDAT